jgi:flagellar hook protein FlgE
MVNKHITDKLPYRLSRVAGGSFNTSGYGYDVAINNQPYFIANNTDRPYRRITAKYRKDQVDQTTEPGEQTLTGWWLRSQTSFHNGAGINYYEPSQDETKIGRASCRERV